MVNSGLWGIFHELLHGFEKKTANIAAQIPQSTGFARHAVDSSICRCFSDPLCLKAMEAPFESLVPHVSACASVDASTELSGSELGIFNGHNFERWGAGWS